MKRQFLTDSFTLGNSLVLCLHLIRMTTAVSRIPLETELENEHPEPAEGFV